MNRMWRLLFIAAIASSPLISQQSNPAGSSSAALNPQTEAPLQSSRAVTAPASVPEALFSRFALGGGIGINGINLQAATIVNRYTNVRLVGNVFGYTMNDIKSNGFTGSGNLSLATMGLSADLYPFSRVAFRLSPGLLLYNDNSVSAHAIVNSGESFTLNHVDYYSSASDPIHATARIGLNAQNPAFTLTTGWGNMISRKGRRWSIPVEIGAAFVGTPSLKMTLTGTACDANGMNCINAATDPTIQSNLTAQIAKYRSDLDPLKVFPIFTVGFSYNFNGLSGAQ